tara:strand:- start:701 stop:1186 length:486 start_codon:yes stop_codon:yes gene_type:complete
MATVTQANAHDVQEYLQEQIASIQNTLKQKYGLDIVLGEFSGSISQRFTFDLEDITDKYELKKKNLNDLKGICKQYGLRYSGKKDDLVDRIWGVKCPEEAPTDSKPKKRGRKTKTQESINSNQSTPVQSPVQSPVQRPVQSPVQSNASSPINSAASSPMSP